MSATGSDLPPELLSDIVKHLDPMITDDTSNDEFHRSKQGLAACSLVCRHWSNAISPMLFERLILSSPEDVRFLRNTLEKARTSRTFLPDRIQMIWIKEDVEDVAQGRSWLHHTHSLCTRLPKTSFHYAVLGSVDDVGPATGTSVIQTRVYSPFRSLPRVPPLSILRLTQLNLDRLHFASKTELARFIDSFPALELCWCSELTFVDPSPIIQSRRLQRRSSLTLKFCSIWRCDGTALSTQATLACDILKAPTRLALDGDSWNAILESLLALVPGSFERADMMLDRKCESASVTVDFFRGRTYKHGEDFITAQMYARQAGVGTASHPFPAFAETLSLAFSLAATDDLESLNFDVLQAIVVDSPRLSRLVIDCESSEPNHYKTFSAILCSVLQRKRLVWALESRKLQFWGPWREDNYGIITSADILSVPTEHADDEIAITLSFAQQVEWILCFGPDEREVYLQKLMAARIDGGASAAARRA